MLSCYKLNHLIVELNHCYCKQLVYVTSGKTVLYLCLAEEAMSLNFLLSRIVNHINRSFIKLKYPKLKRKYSHIRFQSPLLLHLYPRY